MKQIIESTFNQFPNEFERISNGETKLIKFFMGQIMKEVKGKFSPSDILDFLNKKFNKK